MLMVVLNALELEKEFKDWRRGNWLRRVLELKGWVVRADRTLRAAGLLLAARAACVTVAIDRTMAREEEEAFIMT